MASKRTKTNRNSREHPCDAIVARFFGQEQPDWDSADGRLIQEQAWGYLERKIPALCRSGLSHADAEDVVMTAFHKIHSHVTKGKAVRARTIGGFFSFCRTTLANAKTDLHRRASSWASIPQTELGQVGRDGSEGHLARTPQQLRVPEQQSPFALVLADERRQQLRAALAWLREKNRRLARVLELDLDEASTEEIMAELGTSRDNVYQLRTRALAAIDGAKPSRGGSFGTV